MPDPLIVTIGHRLGKDEAMRRVKPALGKVSSTFRLITVEEETWTDDRMDFRVRAFGQRANGNVQVAEDNVRLEVTLPWPLHTVAMGVQRVIESRGRILLGRK